MINRLGILFLLLFPFTAFAQYEILEGPKAFVDITEEAGIEHQFKVYEGMFGGGIMGGASGTNNANQTPQQESPKEN